jgi:Kef-type K+ transport system membrane component KefB
VLDIVKSKDNIHLLADIGIAVLLFIVGLKLDLRLARSIGKIALLTGLGQVVFTSIIGYAIGLLMGFTPMHSFYIAVALTFSSTIIIVKLLSDKKEIDSLHGQISIGFLIVQDMVVILIMIILSAFGKQQDFSLFENIVKSLLSGSVLVVITYMATIWIIPAWSGFLVKSQELLVLFAIAWALTLGSISRLIGFSSEVGAFLAGISLATSTFKETISSRLVSLRDFLLLFFFVNLGSNINLTIIGNQITASVIFSLFVLIGNPVIVLIIMGLMGYRKRTSFLAGLTVAQISEFLLIFAGMGLALGHINEEVLGLITLVGIITIALSTYMIIYSHWIYEWLSPVLTVFEKKNHHNEPALTHESFKNFDLIIFGLGRFGSRIADYLDQHPDIKYLGVDFDPQVVKTWQKKGRPVIYGDIEDTELLGQIPIFNVKAIISTIPDKQYSVQLVRQLRSNGYEGKIFLTAVQDKDYIDLQECKADRVLMLYNMAAENFYNSVLADIVRKN